MKWSKELPPVFSEISNRFTLDFLISERVHLETMVKISAIKFPWGLLPGALKKEKIIIFDKIFNEIVNNDKKLISLLKKANIKNIKVK